ncbi:hypothetical protein B0T18DRAFT_205081 [Schizothecium vesticola]|uniref:Uncharacterized protein n=1 Tax=Schizothecium vesticola TaxID=314040 RepID=A0AA40EJ22_9PEZI|nr:hypothetical protein B0T18DRAFT_205081 [Schizothecium vesticola]
MSSHVDLLFWRDHASPASAHSTLTMPHPDGTTSPGYSRPSTTDDLFAPPTHYLFQDKKRRRAPPRHARIPSLLLNQCSSFEALGSPPPTYSSQPPPPSPPAITDDESDHPDSDDTSSDDARSLTHDGSKDILIERLSHIIRHLQITTESGDMVDGLHSKVDEMYGVMGKFLCLDGRSTDDGNIFGPLSHTTQSRTDQTKPVSTGWTHHFRQQEEEEYSPAPPPKDMTPVLAAEITNLNAQLSTVLQSLRTRKEETDKIQSLLLTHLSQAATHILTLESTITTLSSDLRSSDAALRHLRLELRAVETLWRSSPAGEELTRSMSMGSSPAGSSPRTPGTGTTTVDMELVRSIENWKADWRELRGRDCFPHV